MGFNVISTIRPRAHRAASWVYRQFRFDKSPRQGLRILMYHAIGTPVEGDVRGLYSMTTPQFVMHMRYLAEHYAGQLVPLDRSAMKGGALRIALTFDDGYQDNLLVAAPILVELDIPFTVFVCTGAVAGRKAGFLGPQETRELAGLPGVTIGSHSVNHVRLTHCDARSLYTELRDSKIYLEDLLGKDVNSLSYPYGAVDRRVRDMTEKVGYQIAASSRFDVNRWERDPFLLCRTTIWTKDDLSIFGQKLNGDWDWNRWRSADPSLRP